MSDRIQDILPEHFSIRQEGKDHLLAVKYPHAHGNFNTHMEDHEIFGEVQRECDRIFFLTGMDMAPILVAKKQADGLWISFTDMGLELNVISSVPADVTKQHWHGSLPLQLRFWHLANSSAEPIGAKINFLFQIIEASYADIKDYPTYTDSSIPPDPRTEARLLRNLVSHQGKINSHQLELYCTFLGIHSSFYDPSDTEFHNVINSRFHLVRDEAKKIIEHLITRRNA
jgi:hypothetical protein